MDNRNTETPAIQSLPVRLTRALHGMGCVVWRPPTAEPQDLAPSRRQRALLRIQEWHAQARDLVPAPSLNANLEWILRQRKDAGAYSGRFDEKMIAMVELWLEDLAGKVLGVSDPENPENLAETVNRRSVAGELRKAIEHFVLVFRPPARRKTGARRMTLVPDTPESLT